MIKLSIAPKPKPDLLKIAETIEKHTKEICKVFAIEFGKETKSNRTMAEQSLFYHHPNRFTWVREE